MSHNAIQGITKPALLRMAHRMGIVRLSGVCYEECRGTILEYMREFLPRVVIHTEHNRKKTISVDHVYAAMSPNKVLLTTKDIKACKDKKDAIQTCITFPKASFEKLTRAVVEEYKKDLRIQNEAALLIQYYVEMYMLKLFGIALKLVRHDHRLTVEPRDLSMAHHILKIT